MNRFNPHEFLGRGSMKRNGVAVPISIRGTLFEYEPIPVDCTIMPEGVETLRSYFSRVDEITDIEGVTEDGGMFWISNIQNPSKSLSGSQIVFHGSAENIITGNLHQFQSLEGNLLISAQVPYTPLFDRNQFFTSKEDGTISFGTENISNAMELSTKIGKAKLSIIMILLMKKSVLMKQ